MRKKKEKFRELKTYGNVIEWNDSDAKEELNLLFTKYQSVILELGCGRGEYTVALAKKYPETLFVGIDIQGERIWRGAKDALEGKISNAYFLRIKVENILEYIPKKRIDEIWITFPDPFPKERRSKRRLTSPMFLHMYKNLLKINGKVHLKTDSNDLYEYTKESAKECGFKVGGEIEDTHSMELDTGSDINEVETRFEKKHLEEGKSIKYLQLTL